MDSCKKVWLINDDELSNHLKENILRINNFSSEIRSFTKGKDALGELETLVESEEEFPDFIFLDLNMPDVDGWDFLNTYRKFPKEVKESCALYILSSSINVDDINKSKLHEDVRDFFSKPLHKINLGIIKLQTKGW